MHVSPSRHDWRRQKLGTQQFDCAKKLTNDDRGDEADGIIGGGACHEEWLDQVAGEGQGDHRLAGRLHNQ